MTEPTDEQVEAGARALYERQPMYGATFDIETSDRVSVAERFPWEALTHPVQDRYRDTARAVLAAALPLALADAAEALEPFARAAAFFEERYLDGDAVAEHSRKREEMRLNVGDLRRARAVRARLIASPPRASGG